MTDKFPPEFVKACIARMRGEHIKADKACSCPQVDLENECYNDDDSVYVFNELHATKYVHMKCGLPLDPNGVPLGTFSKVYIPSKWELEMR